MSRGLFAGSGYAVRKNLAEDAEDLTGYRERAKEPSLDLEKVLKDLRRRGKL